MATAKKTTSNSGQHESIITFKVRKAEVEKDEDGNTLVSLFIPAGGTIPKALPVVMKEMGLTESQCDEVIGRVVDYTQINYLMDQRV